MDAMTNAVEEGASDPSLAEVEVVVRPALGGTASDVLEADGFVLGSPVNLGYLSGALKHFFDQIYYPCRRATAGRPFALYLHGNEDATGALRAVDVVTTGLGWRQAQSPVVVIGRPSVDDLAACRELGAAMAAGLLLD
jgi:multimeric flavodoxin WrbA